MNWWNEGQQISPRLHLFFVTHISFIFIFRGTRTVGHNPIASTEDMLNIFTAKIHFCNLVEVCDTKTKCYDWMTRTKVGTILNNHLQGTTHMNLIQTEPFSPKTSTLLSNLLISTALTNLELFVTLLWAELRSGHSYSIWCN